MFATLLVLNNRKRFQKRQRFMTSLLPDFRFVERSIQAETLPVAHNKFKNRTKKLTNRSLGRELTIKEGVGWKEICDEILCDGTHPKSLAAVAAGKWKTANGWEVEVL